MESFQNTLMDVTINSQKLSNTPREGDWICQLCHNLNFSFRKRCNRCKIQTRENNIQPPLYIYYYPKLQCSSNGNKTQFSPSNQNNFMLTPPKYNQYRKEKRTQSPKQLPSVSPLLKKYRASRLGEMQNGQDGETMYLSKSSQPIWCNNQYNEQSTQPDVQLLENQDFSQNEELQNLIRRIMI